MGKDRLDDEDEYPLTPADKEIGNPSARSHDLRAGAEGRVQQRSIYINFLRLP